MGQKRFHSWCAAVVLSLATPLLAAPAATPTAEAYIERYGIDFPFDNEQEIIDLYTRILDATPHDNSTLSIVRDVHYGPNPRHRLDVHVSKKISAAPRPVLIFFHGGGFTEGNTWISRRIYDNVGNYFARQGLVSIVATYRLAPEFQWPSGIEDVSAAVEWARAHASEYGGNPDHVFVMGHSAGAANVADYVFQGSKAGKPAVAGAILLSGVYAPGEEDSVYYGDDRARWPQESALEQVGASPAVPTLVAFAEYDPPPMQIQAMELVRRLCVRDGSCPRILRVRGHNHMSLIFHVDTADDSIGSDVTAFIRANSRPN